MQNNDNDSDSQVNVLTRSVLDVLAKRKETRLIPQVGEALRQIDSRKRNQNLGIVWSVIPINTERLNRIKKIMEKYSKRNIEIKNKSSFLLRNKIDSSLLGGFKMELGDWVLDASLKADFVNIEKTLLSK